MEMFHAAVKLPKDFAMAESQRIFEFRLARPSSLGTKRVYTTCVYDECVVEAIHKFAVACSINFPYELCQSTEHSYKCYPMFHALRRAGASVPDDKTLANWTNPSDNISRQLVLYNGVPCLLDAKYTLKPILPDKKSVVCMALMWACRRNDETGTQFSVEDVVHQFLCRFALDKKTYNHVYCCLVLALQMNAHGNAGLVSPGNRSLPLVPEFAWSIQDNSTISSISDSYNRTTTTGSHNQTDNQSIFGGTVEGGYNVHKYYGGTNFVGSPPPTMPGRGAMDAATTEVCFVLL